MEAGFFEMSDANEVLAKPDLKAAQNYCFDKITDFLIAHPRTHFTNVKKANTMVCRAKNKTALAIALSNFVLAHPSEGLAVK